MKPPGRPSALNIKKRFNTPRQAVLARKNFGKMTIYAVGFLPRDAKGAFKFCSDPERDLVSLGVFKSPGRIRIGWARVTFWTEGNGTRVFLVDDIWLDHLAKGYCEKGIDTWLLGIFENWAREWRAESIYAGLDNRRKGLYRRIHFFHKNGYTMVRNPGGEFSIYKKLMTGGRISEHVEGDKIVRQHPAFEAR